MVTRNKKTRIFLVFLVLAIFLNLPFVTAVQFSNIQASQITDNSALITWETDESADSYVSYGTEKENLRRVGDVASVLEHELPITDLGAEQTYYFQVESNLEIDNNEGEFYSFTTAVQDTETELRVNLPERMRGSRLEVSGTTEVGAEVSLTVNGILVGFMQTEDETFLFTDIFLREEELNTVLIEAVDLAGNRETFSGAVYADTRQPEVELQSFPDYVEETFIELNGIISEEAAYEIFVNDLSQVSGEGTAISEQLNLEEGINTIKIVLIDHAGWSNEEEFTIISDTQAPFIIAEIEKGYEYYETRAESKITGETEPGAKVYLYIYKQRGYEFEPDFEKTWETVTASADGTFSFDEVDFEDEPLRLEDIAPRQVPSRLLEEVTIPELVDDRQYWSYYVYLIAEDCSGKTAYWETTITVNTCYSANLDFVPESVPQFQTPYRLLPQLLDDGRETIQALFLMNYQGDGIPEMRGGEEISPGYQIQNVRFIPACTQGMQEDDSYALPCSLMTRREPTNLISGDDSSVYVEWDLASAEEFSERKDDFWDDFTERRKLVFPLKMVITYQDRLGEDEWSQNKVQTTCTELGYFVDIPLESSEMIPDFLADEGVSALDWTVEQLSDIREILEEVYFWTAITAVSSWLGRMLTRWIRIGSSKIEGIFSPDCPLDQSELFLSSTLEEWREFGLRSPPRAVVEAGADQSQITLDERCPTTAKMWDLEEGLNFAYRWTGDRAFCRSVPAGWTETESLDEIDRVIIQQQQCAGTGLGVPLRRIENCQDRVQQNPINVPTLEGVSICWEDANGIIYRVDQQPDDLQTRGEQERGFFRMIPVLPLLGEMELPAEPLLAYRPINSEDFFVARERTCKQICDDPRRPGYEADFENGVNAYGCYKEVIVDGQTRLRGAGNRELVGDRYAAGYSSDCFVETDSFGNPETPPEDETGLLQCVCLALEEPVSVGGAREAQESEPWSYRQERVFKEERDAGTYYPEKRYYSGRDFSGAFGANYLPDYFRTDPEVHEVNPSRVLASFQSVCLPGILSYLAMWESILEGMRNCLVQAKHTGFEDAGMCKTFFTRQLCGLAYDVVASLVNECSPSTFQEADRDGTFGDVGVVLDQGVDALGDAVSSSIDDFQEDYGNAALNEYFREGAQGFAQSVCLAAFGEEFPLFDRDFWTDAAYAFPMPITPVIAPARREFSSYNPARQTAIYNYDVGAVVLPGCRIRSWDISLVCIGPEAVGQPGVDVSCDGRGCDCLDSQGVSTSEHLKEYPIYQGQALEEKRMFDVPLDSPIRIDDSPFRYDHVKVEFYLDPSEEGNEELCFDEGYYDGSKGVYYTSISDNSPPVTLGCNANFITGEFECPELSTQFGFGGAYLTEPFVTCWNERTDSWMDCDTPNLFVLGDEIKTRVHLNLDGDGQCLRRTVRNVPGVPETPPPRLIPENVAGFYFYEDVLNVLREEMLGGTENRIQIETSESDLSCGELTLLYDFPPASISGGSFSFTYVLGEGLIVPSTVQILGTVYGRSTEGILVQGSNPVLDIAEINQVEFLVDRFRVANVLGNVNTGVGGTCTYRTVSRDTSGASARDIRVTYELLERDEVGSCLYADQPVQTAQGKPSHTVTIGLQRDLAATRETTGLHEYFMQGYYDLVGDIALQIIGQLQGDIMNALAIYYWTASYVIKEADEGQSYQTQIHNLLDAFFNREWGSQRAADYPADLRSTGEFERMEQYMCVIAEQENYAVPEGRCLE